MVKTKKQIIKYFKKNYKIFHKIQNGKEIKLLKIFHKNKFEIWNEKIEKK
jgi:hypothetical protein